MATIPVAITGVSPLLCGGRADPCPDLPPRAQAQRRLYVDADGNAVIPAHNLFQCLATAARRLHTGLPDLGLAAGIAESDLRIDSTQTWQVDTRQVRKPGTRMRIACHRPRFDQWSLRFQLLVDEALLAPANAAALISYAGQRLGLGDFRPECGGPFGRFRLAHWGHPCGS